MFSQFHQVFYPAEINNTHAANSSSPQHAFKHFTSLKTDLIFLQPRVLERKIP